MTVRILCYAQHLSGVGHFVRTHAIAAGLAQAHEVILVDGGVPVPRRAGPRALTLLGLPRIQRKGGVLVPLETGAGLPAVMDDRRRRLLAAVADTPPDILLIEHYPWSKWELEDEILTAADAARRRNPAVRVVGSLRDVAPRTRYEEVAGDVYEQRVLDRLGAHFDALLIHADPRFSRLDDHFSRVRDLPVPWAYTGFVSGTGSEPARHDVITTDAGAARARSPYAVLSASGGVDALAFLRAAIEAFGRVAAGGELDDMRLDVFAGLAWTAPALERLRAESRGGPITVRPFTAEFPSWLAGSALSISRAGYNTCVDLLVARVPAVLVPHPRMSDQRARAQRMQDHGLATLVVGDPPPCEGLADAIRKAAATPRPMHDLALRGVEETRALVEELHRTGTLAGVGARTGITS